MGYDIPAVLGVVVEEDRDNSPEAQYARGAMKHEEKLRKFRLCFSQAKRLNEQNRLNEQAKPMLVEVYYGSVGFGWYRRYLVRKGNKFQFHKVRKDGRIGEEETEERWDLTKLRVTHIGNEKKKSYEVKVWTEDAPTKAIKRTLRLPKTPAPSRQDIDRLKGLLDQIV